MNKKEAWVMFAAAAAGGAASGSSNFDADFAARIADELSEEYARRFRDCVKPPADAPEPLEVE